MKIILSALCHILPLLLIFSFRLSDLTQQDVIHMDVIAYSEVCVQNVEIGAEESKLTSLLGVPEKITSKSNEFEGYHYDVYHYSNNTFNIEDGRLNGFSLNDNSFRFDYGNLYIGSSDNLIKSLFPLSFENRYEDNSSIIVKVRIADSDSYVLFTLNNGVITNIRTWDDY